MNKAASTMAEVATESYDDVLYPSFTHSQTHPDRLATVAMLCGLRPTAVESCRVLELGCGDGGNLIPMALELTGSEFVGLDLAAIPIEKGNTTIESLGLTNIKLSRLDLMDLDSSLGEFDY